MAELSAVVFLQLVKRFCHNGMMLLNSEFEKPIFLLSVQVFSVR